MEFAVRSLEVTPFAKLQISWHGLAHLLTSLCVAGHFGMLGFYEASHW